jgi:N-methylhydantoinase A
VTDADVVLGRLYAESFAGGALQLVPTAAVRALRADICEPLDLAADIGAFGVSEVVDENMCAAARAHAAEFGKDLAARDMVAFGGAAPLHAARLGDKLGVRRIVVPADAGVGSAVGFLLAPVAYEVVRSRQQPLSKLDVTLVNALMSDMHEEAVAVVRPAAGDVELAETRHAYMRYVGQGHEIPVELPPGPYNEGHHETFRLRFEAAYEQLYGRTIGGVDVEALSWTLTISALAGDSDNAATPVSRRRNAAPQALASVSMYDPGLQRRVDAPVYRRETLAPGATVDGPALITEDQTTTVVMSHYRADIDAHCNIVLTRQTETAHE